MKTRRPLWIVAPALAALVGVAGYRLGKAHADGAPTMSPLHYGGVLEDGGRPVEGMRNVTIRLGCGSFRAPGSACVAWVLAP